MAEEAGRQQSCPPSGSGNHTTDPATVRAGLAHGISFNISSTGDSSGQRQRPQPVKYTSAPAYQSPIRHHQRAPSKSKGVKETLNAHSHYGSSDDDGPAVHRINQYVIKQELGRGSFGAVHLAVDQHGNEFAVKEFSKSRLRKRAQSNLLRKPNVTRRGGHLAAGLGFNSPLHRISSSDKLTHDSNNSLNLIKEEIAIMKKLDHNNLVALIEVLDDPEEDSLYMVLEICKKGVVMKVGLDERAVPYAEEACRCWFRDMILGIEYLHHQGIVHRDIKPDNCLVTHDDVLKIVDFGVSEMFEKESDMATTKSAGSPAFMPPELCVARHGQVSGRAADIWSMGVTLYCLRYGHIPFEKSGVLELYESIRSDEIPLAEEKDKNFEDLIRRLLEKDPDKRITMTELRDHPWITKDGSDPLLSAEENCADLVDLPTDTEMDRAITGNMLNILAVMKAATRFKRLLSRRPQFMDNVFVRGSQVVTPPLSMGDHGRGIHHQDQLFADRSLQDIQARDEQRREPPQNLDQVDSKSTRPNNTDPATGLEQAARETGAHFKQRVETMQHHPPLSDPEIRMKSASSRSKTFPLNSYAKGHAHDPLDDRLFLDIGPNTSDESTGSVPGEDLHRIVSESPPAVELNIYEQAYQDEMKRILERRGESATMYLNRRVEHREDLRSHSNVLDHSRDLAQGATNRLKEMLGKGAESGGASGLAALVRQAQADQSSSKGKQDVAKKESPSQSSRLDSAREESTATADSQRHDLA